jgi:DNA-binding response OmpR family regulator
MKVLLVEDSERLQRSLETGLRHLGFAVDVVGDGEAGLAHARHGNHDVIVLDLMLPKMDGLTVLRRLRESGSRAHVLVLSAKGQVDERIQGLQMGADDYLTKPFAFEELVARIRALIRRKYGEKRPVVRVGPWEVDVERRAVTRDGTTLELTRSEYAVLEYLLARRGRVVTKAEFLDHLYAGAGHGSENSVEVLVHQLRKKLGSNGSDDPIRTRRGHGYVIE